MNIVFGIDIDGVTEWGKPPGPVTVKMLKNLTQAGHKIVGASAHRRAPQIKEFESRGIELAGCPGKAGMQYIKAIFLADRYIWVDDGPLAVPLCRWWHIELMRPEQFCNELSLFLGRDIE